MPAPEMTVLRLALPLPLPSLFDYLPPEGVAATEGLVGCRARVAFGKKQLVGFIAQIGTAQAYEGLRRVDEVIDCEPLLHGELWRTLCWTAAYYHRPLGDVLATALPALVRQGGQLPETRHHLWGLTEAGHTARKHLRAGTRPRAMAERLATGDVSEEALVAVEQWRATLRSLQQRGYAQRVPMEKQVQVRVLPARVTPELNQAQRDAVVRIESALGNFAPLLLDGVTGSGKTEVYLAAIETCLARGTQALVLVPEIGLTPQALRRYGERLPVPVHALHSGLGDGERARAWAAMARGDARVLVGTRSAVFTPLPEAGLIVIDEEHDASYKQQDGLRYHARDLGLMRGKALGVPVVLGSATPSLETLQQVRCGRYESLRLAARAGAARPPSFHVVDIRTLPLKHGLSAPLIAALHDCMARGEQALVFRNRRGYAPALLCHDCGWNAVCLRCDTAMTLHGRARLICHHCGAHQPAPSACPDCHGLGLVPQGAGTERLEQALADAFPDVPRVRVDRETTQHRGALDRHFATLGDAPGILVGTQMLAKGHDLPLLTLVAIASIDDGLYSADFRAPERLAQLLVQVAGRAGRAARAGHVWLQTHHPQHPLLRTLLSGGYHAFAELELAERKAAGFPPFVHLALLRAEALEQERLDAFLRATHALMRQTQACAVGASPAVDIHTPMPAPMPLRAGRRRAQLLLSCAQRMPLHALLREAMPALYALREARKVRWSLDVDPVDLY